MMPVKCLLDARSCGSSKLTQLISQCSPALSLNFNNEDKLYVDTTYMYFVFQLLPSTGKSMDGRTIGKQTKKDSRIQLHLNVDV